MHGKGSLYGRMPGDDWQRRANVRAYLAWLWTQPGKKLIFMGCELGQHGEWNHDTRARLARRRGHQPPRARPERPVPRRPALSATDADGGRLRLERRAQRRRQRGRVRATGDGGSVAVVANFAPVVREGYHLRLPHAGPWRLVLDTDAAEYGGSGVRPADPLRPPTAARR